MTAASDREAVFVEAPARLHFGVLDLRGSLGRWFGGIGAAAPEPTLLVSATSAPTIEVHGEDAERAEGFARRFLSHYQLKGGARIQVHRALPAHAGLGSGTQLALAVARVLAELHGQSTDPSDLACASGRGERSAIGTWIFEGGGLVVEGGHRAGVRGTAPLLARVPFPASWRCVVAVPDSGSGISGADEAAALAALEPPPVAETERVSHLVLMGLLPALRDGDLATFGSALTEIQTITGRWFAPIQGGAFAPGPGAQIVRLMAEWGARGVGQSSWGPAVYGIVEDEQASAALAQRVRGALGERGRVYAGAFREEGARVWRVPTEK
jgi:beta-RFAP synthase